MEVNTSNQCVRVYFDDQVLNVQPLVVLTQDITGVAQEATLVEGIDDIRADISGISIDTTTIAKQGSNTSATLTDTQAYALAAKTAAEGITIPTDYALQGSDTTATNTAILSAIGNISIDTTDLAKQGTDSTATLTATQTAAEAAQTAAEAISGYALQGSDTTATNTAMLSVLNSISANMYKGVVVVSQSTDATIAPNVWNVWGSVGSLTITKGTDINGVVNEYMIRFTASSSTALTFSGWTLTWYGGSEPSWTDGSTYEISIIDNLALWAEFA